MEVLKGEIRDAVIERNLQRSAALLAGLPEDQRTEPRSYQQRLADARAANNAPLNLEPARLIEGAPDECHGAHTPPHPRRIRAALPSRCYVLRIVENDDDDIMRDALREFLGIKP